MSKTIIYLLLIIFPGIALASGSLADYLLYLFLSYLPLILILLVIFLLSAAVYYRIKGNNSKTVSMDDIKHNFKEALQVMAAAPTDQVRCTEPGGISEKIWDDFMLWTNYFRQQFSSNLDDKIVTVLDELIHMTDSISNLAFKETNIESMQQPEWEPLRTKSKELLQLLDWPVEIPASYVKGN